MTARGARGLGREGLHDLSRPHCGGTRYWSAKVRPRGMPADEWCAGQRVYNRHLRARQGSGVP
jgi:hypothetical protein